MIVQLEMSRQQLRILVWSTSRSWAGDRTENHQSRKSTRNPISGMELPRETVWDEDKREPTSDSQIISMIKEGESLKSLAKESGKEGPGRQERR